jgi:phospholipid transport system transporter-binding protein
VIEQRDGRYWISGPITIQNVLAVREEGLRRFSEQLVDLELSALSEIDSSALSVFFEWSRILAGQGKRIRFHNATDSLRSLASVYEVLDLLPSS